MAQGKRGSQSGPPEVNNRQYIQFLENLDDAVAIIRGTTIVYVNEPYLRLHGYEAKQELLGRDVTTVIAVPDRERVLEAGRNRLEGGREHNLYDFMSLGRDGRQVPVEVRAVPVLFDGEPAALAMLRDITPQRLTEEMLNQQALHDPLTDLLNRRGFRRAMEAAIGDAKAAGNSGCLLLLDIDQFKDVNDSLGHPAGDQILQSVARFLREVLAPGRATARLGGDEFAVILPSCDLAGAEEFGHRLVDRLSKHLFETDAGDSVYLTGSVGLAMFPDHGSTVEELLSRVDIALYSAKDRGRNRFRVFVPQESEGEGPTQRLALRRQLRDALENDRLALFAQPIIDLKDGSVVAYELLARIQTEDGGVIAASDFILEAERSGLVLLVDRWVVLRVIELLRELRRLGADMRLGINLSGRALEDAEMRNFICTEFDRDDLDLEQLTIEIAETAAISTMENARDFFAHLRARGCRFSLDDFGVGAASISKLRLMRVDSIKIDGSFIENVVREQLDRDLVKAMVTIADALGMHTVAECVGAAEEVEMLRELGVGYAQGDYLGEPRDVELLMAELRQKAHAA